MVKLKSELVNLVKITGEAGFKVLEEELHSWATEKFGKIDTTVKIDYSLVRALCQVVEAGLVKNSKVSDEKFDKKKLVIDEYCRLKEGLNEVDKQLIDKYIEDLHSAKAIKPLSAWRRLKKYVSKKLNDVI
ncbi:MAG: hypothetical protein EOO43_01515 [Flavobacterium sp.]|nr:MAG: hypothetical protein EOO43_01515 [Flavobacterium sp.]